MTSARYRTAFPDLRFNIQTMRADRDYVTMVWTSRGTHEGPLGELSPTFKKVAIKGVTLFRLEAGKVAEEWTVWDEATMLRQLGVMQ